METARTYTSGELWLDRRVLQATGRKKYMDRLGACRSEALGVREHYGMRSLDAAAWLRSQGIAGARSMCGGIDRWSIEIDASVPRY
ncbi:MAG: hypothetical protein ACRD50_14885 [Candidatus Acidiferrales bacterium]